MTSLQVYYSPLTKIRFLSKEPNLLHVGSDRGNSSDTILKITIASVMPFLISVSVGTAIVAVIFKIISSRRRPNYRQLNNEG